MEKVFIFGGCVTRDIFNLSESKDDFKVVDYVARCSFASLSRKPKVLKETLASIESQWQRRMVELDMNKKVLSKVRTGDFDVAIIDFLSIRFNLAVDSRERYAFTISTEFKRSNKSIALKTVPKYSDRMFDLWLSGFREFSNSLLKNPSLKKIYINKLYWTGGVNGGRALEGYSESQIEEANRNLDKCYKAAEKILPEAVFIEYPKDIFVVDEKHRWGAEPFHYTRDVYSHALEFLSSP